MYEFGNLTIGFIRCDHKLDPFAEESPHSDSDDPVIDDNTPTQVLPGLFLHTLLQKLQSFLPIFFLLLLPLIDSVIFLAHISAIKHYDRFDVVEGQDLQHFENVVKKFVGLDILVVLVCASVAAFVEPRHDIDGCGLIAESADVLVDGDRAE